MTNDNLAMIIILPREHGFKAQLTVFQAFSIAAENEGVHMAF